MKIAIIKLGADGDVLRTLPVIKAIRDKYNGSEITLVTRGDIADLLENIGYISKVVNVPHDLNDNYDLLYNFDIEKQALELAGKINANKKFGFCSNEGYPAAFNPGAEYYLNTIFDDELKKANKKTYQEMMFEAAELIYEKEIYQITLTDKDRKYAEEFRKINNLQDNKIIGIHMGSSSRWPSKAWNRKNLIEFIKLAKSMSYDIILFGGPNESGKHEELCNHLKKNGIDVYRNNPNNSKREFASLIGLCDFVVCSDSLALHVSLGLGRKTACLFFCTSPDEVEGYGLLNKVVSPKLYEFFPERSDEYSEELTSSISPEDVMREIIL